MTLSDDELSEFNKKQIFVRDGMPGEWLALADELAQAAEALWSISDDVLRVESEEAFEDNSHQKNATIRKISGVSRPYLLLAGFFIENMLKGLMVAKNPDLLRDGIIPSQLKTHNLLSLASNIESLNLSDNEGRVIRILQDAIPYWGRYPIPLQSNGVMPEVALDEEFRQGFLDLKYRLGKIVYDKIRDGWKSGVGPEHLPMIIAEYEDQS